MTTATLMDISNNPRTVEVAGKEIAVYGISGRAIASLLTRFPEIGKAFSGMTPDKDKLMKLAPEALAAFIAAGCGFPGEAEAESFAGNLSVGDQLELVAMIIKLTFPRGVGPFIAQLEALGMLAVVEMAALPGAGQLTPQSPLPSKNLSTKDTPDQK